MIYLSPTHSSYETFVKVRDKSNIVYKITCRNCNDAYKGHTSRCLSSRIITYKSDVRLKRLWVLVY